MDPSGDGGGGLTTAELVCGSCGVQCGPTAKFCGECGTRLAEATRSAEYKQVTVLFADVVHSMDIAAALGAEPLREIMSELVNRASAAVQRFGGTVDKFTGDMAMSDSWTVRAAAAGASRILSASATMSRKTLWSRLILRSTASRRPTKSGPTKSA